MNYSADELRISDALKIYFSAHGFTEGGYKEKYYHIVLGPLRIPVPNTKKRLMAVKFHDIHHVLTGYTAFWKGEIQIGAWELASGCGNFLIAWILNFGSFGVGVFLYPRLLFNAFMKGLRAKTNLYYSYSYDTALLQRTVAELRNELEIDHIRKNCTRDYFIFSFWLFLVFLELAVIIFLFYLIIH
jgi:hypothetical protein